MANGSIINFGGIGQLAKPVEKLIEKVAGAAGVLYEPTRIRRKAQAEAEAREIEVRSMISTDRLLTQAQIENRELAKRALTRFVQEETRAQQNMEDVLEGATKYLKEDAEPEKMEDDWVTHFFNKCRGVSNKEMQDLWSKVLAGEANYAGSFSKRTVEFISTVSKSEAEAFTRLCHHTWTIQSRAVPLVLDWSSGICKTNGINFDILTNLDSLGLIHFNNITGYVLQELPIFVLASYFDDVFQLTIPNDKKRQLEIGRVLFSSMGLELLSVTQCTRVEGIVEQVLGYWAKQGYVAACPWPKA